jgi:peptide-methionine (S)-S-oxide reductase
MKIALNLLLALSLWTGAAQAAETKTAVFAGGCFWCMESDFEHYKGKGVVSVVSGYTGGTTKNPTYHEVSEGDTGHFEAVEVTYDPAVIGYDKLLDIFWRNVDPFDPYGQFCDKGTQYRAAIFFGSEAEKAAAEASEKKIAEKFGKPVATLILPQATFYPAEDYHQDYHDKSSLRYMAYRRGCGRDASLEKIWGEE